MGINTAFVSAGLAGNNEFREALIRNDIRMFLIFPVFQDPVSLEQDSTLYAITNKGTNARDRWVEFVCPSRVIYRKSKVDELASIIRRLNPDGISIDFIRHFVFWEMIYPGRDPASIDRTCYCDSCVAEFSCLEGITFPDTCRTLSGKTEWITRYHQDSWDSFRSELIASMLTELAAAARQVKPDLVIGAHIVPWKKNDFGGSIIRVAGQDLEKMAPVVDYVSPMCYSKMLKRDADWIADVVSEMDLSAPGKVLPSIQVHQAYIDDPFSDDEFRQCVGSALKAPSQGVVFFSWPLFERDPARMNIAKEMIAR